MTGAALALQEGPRHRAGALLPCVGLALAAGAQLAGTTAAILLGLACFVAGLAHGAAEETEGRIAAFGPVRALAYVAIGLAVAGLFLALPIAGLTLFLLLSLWHFARSECAMGPLARAAVGMLAIGGSALFRPSETTDVFAAIVGFAPPSVLVPVLSMAGVAGSVLVVAALVRRERGALLAASCLPAAILFHPVLAVGLVFLSAHALPVQAGQVARYGRHAVLRAALWPSLAAGAGALASIAAVSAGLVPMPLAAALAFGLATPHMLTERLEA